MKYYKTKKQKLKSLVFINNDCILGKLFQKKTKWRYNFLWKIPNTIISFWVLVFSFMYFLYPTNRTEIKNNSYWNCLLTNLWWSRNQQLLIPLNRFPWPGNWKLEKGKALGCLFGFNLSTSVFGLPQNVLVVTDSAQFQFWRMFVRFNSLWWAHQIVTEFAYLSFTS